MYQKKLSVFIFIVVLLYHSTSAQQSSNDVKIVGQMKNVMWKRELKGTIDLDTIRNRKHLYGMGPVEYLTGEILVIDGRAYKSTVVNATSMKVEETFNIKAPFFGYANVPNWTEHNMPDSIQTIQQLEIYLQRLTNNSPGPFFFKLTGTIHQAKIHIVNLPKGSKVTSPDEAHRGQVNYELKNEQVEIVGFFSTKHKAVFTHHDTWLHMHLITTNRQKMGHLDDVFFQKGINLYLPAVTK